MSEMYIKGRWKNKSGKGFTKSTSPMIGMVYEGIDKFYGRQVMGVLVSIHQENNEGVIQSREGKLISTDIKSLKVITI